MSMQSDYIPASRQTSRCSSSLTTSLYICVVSDIDSFGELVAPLRLFPIRKRPCVSHQRGPRRPLRVAEQSRVGDSPCHERLEAAPADPQSGAAGKGGAVDVRDGGQPDSVRLRQSAELDARERATAHAEATAHSLLLRGQRARRRVVSARDRGDGGECVCFV